MAVVNVNARTAPIRFILPEPHSQAPRDATSSRSSDFSVMVIIPIGIALNLLEPTSMRSSVDDIVAIVIGRRQIIFYQKGGGEDTEIEFPTLFCRKSCRTLQKRLIFRVTKNYQ